MNSDIYRELLDSEDGTIVKRGADLLNVALVYPNTYHVGMSSLGFQSVYGLGNRREGVRVERYFHDLPEPRTLESRLPLREVDVLAFSVSFELDLVNIVDILERAGLPLLARDRSDDHPLILAGGSAIALNRLPIYDVCDVFAHGDGELIVEPLLEVCAANRGDRSSVLAALAEAPGLEVTSGAQAACGVELGVMAPAACVTPDLDAQPIHSIVLTDKTAFGGKCLIEISRGCPYRCSFCWAGHNIQPYRVCSGDAIIRIIESQRPRSRSFGFVAAAVGAHPEIDVICRHCDAADLDISFSSLRVEDVTETMLNSLARSGQRSVTLAPEAGAQRLRRALGKRIDDERFFAVAERAVSLGIPDVKLYFMTGLPGETEDEADEITRFVERFRERFVSASRPKGRIGSITVNLGVYAARPNTPLGRLFLSAESTDEGVSDRAVRKRLARLTRSIQALPNVQSRAGSVDLASAQRTLGFGDRHSLELLRLANAPGSGWRAALRQWNRRPPTP